MWSWQSTGAWIFPEIRPHPWERTGPGIARDGKPKFDLTKFNNAYFKRLRERVEAAARRGIYVSVMFFVGGNFDVPDEWSKHPFHRDNNINGIDGDVDGDGKGTDLVTVEVRFMWLSNTIMVTVTAILFVLAVWKTKGIPVEELKGSGKTFLTMLPIIICAFMCEGLIKAIVPPSWIQKWLAVESGWRGVAIGCIAGALTPGGPYTSFPIAMLLLRSGAGLGTVVAYLTAWQLWSITRYPMEIAFVGLNITLLRFSVTFFVPPLAGFLAHWVSTHLLQH